MGSGRFRSRVLGFAAAISLGTAGAVWADAPAAPSVAPARDLSAYKEETLPGGALAGIAYLLLLGLVGGYAAWTAKKVEALQAQLDALDGPAGDAKP